MTMKKWFFGLAALPFLAGAAFAGGPVSLSDNQMDRVTAGFDFLELDISNTSTTMVAVNQPAVFTCATCYLNVVDTWFGTGRPHIQILSQFGPPPPPPPPQP